MINKIIIRRNCLSESSRSFLNMYRISLPYKKSFRYKLVDKPQSNHLPHGETIYQTLNIAAKNIEELSSTVEGAISPSNLRENALNCSICRKSFPTIRKLFSHIEFSYPSMSFKYGGIYIDQKSVEKMEYHVFDVAHVARSANFSIDKQTCYEHENFVLRW